MLSVSVAAPLFHHAEVNETYKRTGRGRSWPPDADSLRNYIGLFNEYFGSVCRPDNRFIPSCSSNTESCLDSVEINESNVLAAIKKLQNNYTSGPDGLPAFVF